MNLGRKRTDLIDPPGMPDVPDVTYPSFCLNDDVAKEFIEAHEINLGKEFEATVKLKVTGVRKDEYGQSVTFDVFELNTDGESSSKEEGGEEKNDKMKSKKPAINALLGDD